MGNYFVENYENLSDDEIVGLINGGDYELLQVIINRYYPAILSCVRKYCPVMHREDAIQEAILALYSAVRDYSAEKASFKSFAMVCIKRAVIAVLKKNMRKKDIPEELLSPLDEVLIIDSNSPEKIFFDREDFKKLTDTIKLELSELEYKVLQDYLLGNSYTDIAKNLNISEKSVDNSLARIRKKLKEK